MLAFIFTLRPSMVQTILSVCLSVTLMICAYAAFFMTNAETLPRNLFDHFGLVVIWHKTFPPIDLLVDKTVLIFTCIPNFICSEV